MSLLHLPTRWMVSGPTHLKTKSIGPTACKDNLMISVSMDPTASIESWEFFQFAVRILSLLVMNTHRGGITGVYRTHLEAHESHWKYLGVESLSVLY